MKLKIGQPLTTLQTSVNHSGQQPVSEPPCICSNGRTMILHLMVSSGSLLLFGTHRKR